MQALDDPHPDIQLVALRSLAAAGAPETFPVLRERLHAVVQGKSASPPLPGLLAAMVSFDLGSAPDLLPSLLDPNWQLRLYAMEILRRIVCRAAARYKKLALTPETLTPPMVDLLLTALAHDASADIRARAADVVAFLSDSRAPSVLRELLTDSQWLVRLHATRSLARLRQAGPVYLEARDRLRDPHWRVREAAIQTLVSFGPEGQHHLYVHFLTSPDRTIRAQIIEVIERVGLMSSLIEKYGQGRECVDAFMIEEITSDAVPAGLPGVLRTLSPEVCHKFMQRFLPYAEGKRPLLSGLPPVMINAIRLQQTLRLRYRATGGGIPQV
jgi:HEAT repeat protein